MTLFKQMALAVSLLILTILGAVMVQNYHSAKKDMTENLYEMTVNNINALSTTLANNANKASVMRSILNAPAGETTLKKDQTPAIVKSIIDAAFDSGYYKRIEFTTDTYSYKQEDNDPIEGVPAWFVQLSNIQVKPVTTEVTNNWMSIGNLSVSADQALTYKALYKMFINLIELFIVAATVSLLLLAIMLHFILRPLKKIKHQAEAITNNEFIIETQIPYTTEFKEVSKAMNSMVRRVKEIFEQATQALQRNKELQYNDPVTKLFNRRYLMMKLPELITLEGKTQGGVIVLLALDGAMQINQILGRQKADKLFFDFAQQLRTTALMDEESITARVNGTEFITVLPNTNKKDAQEFAKKILTMFQEVLQNYELSQAEFQLNIGIYKYESNITVGELLTRVDTALLHAKNDENSNVYFYEDSKDEASMSKTQWREILEQGIDNASFSLHFSNVKDTQTGRVLHKVVSFELITPDKKVYDYNSIIAPIISLGLTSNVYFSILKILFEKYQEKLRHAHYSLKLPKEFFEDESNFDKLTLFFAKEKKKSTKHLSFEIADSFASHKTATVLGYVDLFKKYGYTLGLYSYSASANDFSYLQDINPAFIKADAHFLLDQSHETINNLQLVAKSLDIDIIATAVCTQDDIRALQKYHIYKLQGPIVDKI